MSNVFTAPRFHSHDAAKIRPTRWPMRLDRAIVGRLKTGLVLGEDIHPWKTMIAGAAALLLLSAAPALAMSCCGGGKGKGAMMCGKGTMAMTQGGMKGKKGGCCCDGMSGSTMSKRT